MLILKKIEKKGMVLTGIYAKEERSPLWGVVSKEPEILIHAEFPSWGWSKTYKPKGFIINEEGTKPIESEEDIEGLLVFYYDRVRKDLDQYRMECVEAFV